MSIAQNGNTVTVHYTGTLNNGTQFDSSLDKDPINFEIGGGSIIPGFNDSIIGMTAGEKKTFIIKSDDAYGPLNDDAIQMIPVDRFPPDFKAIIGETVAGNSADGQGFMAKIMSVQDETITLNFNHPLAGEDLTFEVELLEVS